MLINREKAIAAIEALRQKIASECQTISHYDARRNVIKDIDKALRALPVSDGVTDEMVEAAAKAICYDAIQMGDAHGVVMSRVNAAWKEYRQVARTALEAALGPLPAPPTIE